MGDFGDTSISLSRINLSRNTPVALVIGAGGFLGSHLVEKLLKKGIQVIGVDDFSTGHRTNLTHASKDKNFHLVDKSINHQFNLTLPRLDYAFYVASSFSGIHNFLHFIKAYSPKITLASSINLYDSNIPHELSSLKRSEIDLARFARDHKLNARVVRLASLYGPRMHFREEDPVVRLIQASLLDELQKEQTSLDFSSRALYVDDAVDLLIKTSLSGSTAQKIYDGVLSEPVKVSDIKQVLLDPLWYEQRGFEKTPLPPWKTPNLDRTIRELSFKPQASLVRGLKETISYFKDNNIAVPRLGIKELEREVGEWEKEAPKVAVGAQEKEDKAEQPKKEPSRILATVKQKAPLFLAIALIVYALVFPVLSLGFGAFSIREHLKASSQALQVGDFERAEKEVVDSKNTLSSLKGILGSTAILRRVGLLTNQLNSLSDLMDATNNGLSGVEHATRGARALSETTKIISGEENSDPKPLFDKAKVEFDAAADQISQVRARLEDPEFSQEFPILASRVSDFDSKLKFYSGLVEKGRAAANFLPELVAVDGKKSYLVLLEDNLELRPGGGVVEGYALLNFEQGRLKSLKVDDISKLDSSLTEHIEPPQEIKTDLGRADLKLRDANFDPDFPTTARLNEFIYSKATGERVNGVMALDLYGSANLLSAVNGVDLPEVGEHIDSANLFSKVLSHNSTGYLVSLETALFNKIFFLPSVNQSQVAQALSQSLDQKHLLLYLDDPALFSYISAENWDGVIKRPSQARVGKTEDFLAMVDSNMGANKANFNLTRSYKLETSIASDGGVFHHLTISFKNSSEVDKYKDRFRIYLSVGAKLNKASFGGSDILPGVSAFSDYGRAGYSMLVEVPVKESQDLVLDYSLPALLNFEKVGESSRVSYSLYINKEAGTDKDSFDWNLTYPNTYTLISIGDESATSARSEVNISTDLEMDRTLSVGLSK